jgi:peptidoglycan/LPS O-acetylase OafA/YrhL
MRPEELPALTGLRGIAALTVVGFHYRVPGFAYGYLAVDLFFVLSGFVLAHVYRGGVEPRPFYRARAARTLPTHFVATGTVGAAAVVYGGVGWLAVVQNLVGLNTLNEPTWSLIIEWYAYLAFPFVAAIPSAKRLPAPLIIVVAGACGLVGLAMASPVGLPVWNDLRGLGEFAVGVGLYRAGCRPRPSRLLDSRLARWLGDISYPLYLIHLLPLIVLTADGRVPVRAVLTIGNAGFGIAVSIALAVLLHHLVEQPARRWLRARRPAVGTSIGRRLGKRLANSRKAAEIKGV